MLGFRKALTVRVFWFPRLEGMFSGKNEPGWNLLKASFHDSALEAVEPKLFYTHIQAMTIEIASMVITQSSSIDVNVSSGGVVYEFLKEQNRLDIDALVSRYASAFGSSLVDGIRPMVDLFSAELSGSMLATRTQEGIYRTLVLLAQQVRDTLKSVKLVP